MTTPPSFEHVLITARQLASRPLIEQIALVLQQRVPSGTAKEAELARPSRVILREKDMPDASYAALAVELAALCDREGVELMWQSHVQAALSLAARAEGAPPAYASRIQMGMADFLHLAAQGAVSCFECCWVSVHTLEEAQLAASLGAHALIYGHVYETSCKPGLPPRGLEALREIVQQLPIPVYAIGGITGREQCEQLRQLGCAGACVMSSYMQMRSSSSSSVEQGELGEP